MRVDETNFVSNQLKKKKNADNEVLVLNYAPRHEYAWESVDIVDTLLSSTLERRK
jgi:hypothetical protein